MSETEKPTTETKPTAARGRGPAYPYVDLPKALTLLEKIVAAKLTPKHPVAPEAIYGFLGMAPKSSAARQSLAALKYYGLVEYSGTGKDRRVRLTERAAILAHDRDPSSKRRERALREAALAPSIFQEIYTEQGGPFLPAREALETFLKLDKGFDEDSSKRAVGHFLNTIELAGLDQPDSASVEGDENDSPDEEDGVVYGGARPGDMIQWESHGVLKLPRAAKVRAVSDDGEYVAVEGYESWVPMSQTIVETKVAEPPAPPPFPFRDDGGSGEGMKEDTFATSDGDVVIRWPVNLSSSSIEDVEDWTALILRKVKREIARREAEEEEMGGS